MLDLLLADVSGGMHSGMPSSCVLCSVPLFSFVDGVNKMFWIIVLSKGFVEVIEFLLLRFCCTTMCLYAVEEGSKAAHLVLRWVVAVVI